MGFTNFPNGITSFGMPIFGNRLGSGNVFHMVSSKASTDPYYTLLKDRVDDDVVVTNLIDAYALMSDNQGDVLIIYPGGQTSAASLTWAKSNCTLVGAGSINQAYQPATLPSGGVRLTCTTASVAQILNITGHFVSLYNLGTFNNAGTSNLSDIRVAGRNFYAYGCSFRGGNTASGQLDTDGAGVPVIIDATVSGGGNAALFERCTIGSSGNGVRSKGPGCLKFLGPGANSAFGMHFKDCTFSARVEIATANNVGLVDISGNGAVDRELLFDGCVFYNFVQNLGTGPTYVFRDSCGTTHQIVLKNSTMNKGFTSWTDAATYLSCSNPTGTVAGGLGVNS